MLNLILAVAKNDVIGNKGKLPWDFPEDLQRFKRITNGHTLIMGRLTYESLGRALPNRRNIVVSSTLPEAPSGTELARTLPEALTLAFPTVPKDSPEREVFVIGGASLYKEAMPRADRIYLTEIDLSPEGDVRFRPNLTGFELKAQVGGVRPEVTYFVYERTSSRPNSAENPV